MQDLADNNLVRFTNISRKKNNLFANFKMKGIRNGVSFSASIQVDFSTAERNPGDSLEDIIQDCAKIGIKEFMDANFTVEKMVSHAEPATV